MVSKNFLKKNQTANRFFDFFSLKMKP